MATTDGAVILAEAYERDLVPSLFAGWATSMLEMVAPSPGASVLDVGCGTGIVARLAAQRVGAGGCVVGVDIDQSMLRVATGVSSPMVSGISWVRAEAGHLPLHDGSFDVVVCQQALQFLADAELDAALREMRRVLATGGRAAANVWRGVQWGSCAEAVGHTLGPYIGDVDEGIGRPCDAGDAQRLAARTTAAGFRSVQTDVIVEHLRSSSADGLLEQAVLLTSLGPAITALDSEVRSSLVDKLGKALGPYKVDGLFAIPIEATVVLAQGR